MPDIHIRSANLNSWTTQNIDARCEEIKYLCDIIIQNTLDFALYAIFPTIAIPLRRLFYFYLPSDKFHCKTMKKNRK